MELARTPVGYMYFAGSSAYYDEYVRRGGSKNATLHDPPSLLTDRGAYVNFLEVQLERVSAACLSVSSYDDRFNDMQRLVVNLEEKIQLNTQMLGLNQRYAEESKTELQQKLDGLNSALSERLDSLQSDVNGIYRDLKDIRSELAGVTDRLDRQGEVTRNTTQSLAQQLSEIDHETRNLCVFVNTLGETVANMKSEFSRASFQMQEQSSRAKTLFEDLRDKQQSAVKALTEDMQLKVKVLESKYMGDIERLEKHILTREIEIISSIRKFKDEADEEYAERAERAANSVSLACMEEIARVNRETTQRIEDLQRRLGRFEEHQEKAESAISGNFDEFADSIGQLQEQWSVHSAAFRKLEDAIVDTKSFAKSQSSGARELGMELQSKLGRMVRAQKFKQSKRPVIHLARQKSDASRSGSYENELTRTRTQVFNESQGLSQVEQRQTEERGHKLESLIEAYHRDAEESRKSLETLSEALQLKNKQMASSPQNANTSETVPVQEESHPVGLQEDSQKIEAARTAIDDEIMVSVKDRMVTRKQMTSAIPAQTVVSFGSTAATQPSHQVQHSLNVRLERLRRKGRRAPWIPPKVRFCHVRNVTDDNTHRAHPFILSLMNSDDSRNDRLQHIKNIAMMKTLVYLPARPQYPRIWRVHEYCMLRASI